PIQEPVTTLAERIAFCAAIDENGYLPTHNRKFSQAHRPGDSVWNTANCRRPYRACRSGRGMARCCDRRQGRRDRRRCGGYGNWR
ncbi:methyl-accepting chemotaxis protein, partial [Rhizobium johnstonii]